MFFLKLTAQILNNKTTVKQLIILFIFCREKTKWMEIIKILSDN